MDGLNPITRREVFLAAASGDQVETPEPITREEMYLKKIAELGGGSDLPDDPAQDGTYNLQNTVSSGTGTLSWASGSSGGGVLVVKFTAGHDGWTCDKTYAEIVSAITSGTPIMCVTNNNSETGSVKYVSYEQAVYASFFEVSESTLYVIALTIDSSDSVSEADYSVSLS